MSYIVVEGMDFSGKTTLIKKLGEIYKSRLVKEVFDESPIAKEISKSINNRTLEGAYAAQMLVATRVDLFTKLGMFAYDGASQHLISDRSFITTMVYQSETVKEAHRNYHLNVDILKLYGFDIIPRIILYIDLTHQEAVDNARSVEGREFNALDRKMLDEKHFSKAKARYELSLQYICRLNPETKVIRLKMGESIESVVSKLDAELKLVNRIPVSKKPGHELVGRHVNTDGSVDVVSLINEGQGVYREFASKLKTLPPVPDQNLTSGEGDSGADIRIPEPGITKARFDYNPPLAQGMVAKNKPSPEGFETGSTVTSKTSLVLECGKE